MGDAAGRIGRAAKPAPAIQSKDDGGGPSPAAPGKTARGGAGSDSSAVGAAAAGATAAAAGAPRKTPPKPNGGGEGPAPTSAIADAARAIGNVGTPSNTPSGGDSTTTTLVPNQKDPDSAGDEPRTTDDPPAARPLDPEVVGKGIRATASAAQHHLAGDVPEGEPHSIHHHLGLPDDDIVEASVNVTIDELPPDDGDGLTFFALQVDFANGAGAHGGLIRGSDGTHGSNWGALSGNDDYAADTDEEREASADRIQNVEERTPDVDWEVGQEYELRVTRGDRVTLPEGEYPFLDDTVDVDHEREMREWVFTVTPVGSDEPISEQVVYADADTIESFGYWTETGYGITASDRIGATWSNPEYVSRSARDEVRVPTEISVTGDQSDAPEWSTSNIRHGDDTANLETITEFGVPRTSPPGTVLYG